MEQQIKDTNNNTIYVIYNTISQTKTLFYHNNNELAKRHFIKYSNSNVSVRPEEFQLHKIGT
jgi:hypothetical protein